MKFEKKLSVRKLTAIVLMFLGITQITVGIYLNTEITSSIGWGFLCVGFAQLIKLIRICSSEERKQQLKIKETDERNLMIQYKALNYAVSIFIVIISCAVIVLSFLRMEREIYTLSCILLLLCILYFPIHLILSKKY